MSWPGLRKWAGSLAVPKTAIAEVDLFRVFRSDEHCRPQMGLVTLADRRHVQKHEKDLYPIRRLAGASIRDLRCAPD